MRKFLVDGERQDLMPRVDRDFLSVGKDTEHSWFLFVCSEERCLCSSVTGDVGFLSFCSKFVSMCVGSVGILDLPNKILKPS